MTPSRPIFAKCAARTTSTSEPAIFTWRCTKVLLLFLALVFLLVNQRLSFNVLYSGYAPLLVYLSIPLSPFMIVSEIIDVMLDEFKYLST